MAANYKIWSSDGRELAVSAMGLRESRAMAQDLADELGATVYLSDAEDSDSDGAGERIEPRGRQS